MKVLLWMPPWSAHGDPLFYKNCLEKHLIPQGNLLAMEGWDVSLFLPENLKSSRSLANAAIKVIDFSIDDQFFCFGSLGDLSLELYKGLPDNNVESIAAKISSFLGEQFDIVLLWETPVPFLEKLYPKALIVNQMPGAFSRPPYPHTVIFDPVGLYNHGLLNLYSEDIKSSAIEGAESELAADFVAKVRRSVCSLQPFSRDSFDPKRKFSKLALLPLQVSAHYAFQADTSYKNQMEFLQDVLKDSDPSTGVIVTQYVTPRVSDTVLNPEALAVLCKMWPNIIYKPEFDKINSVSQFVIPFADEVITCSSSIGLQALAWSRSLRVYGDTFVSGYADPEQALTSECIDEKANSVLGFILGRHQPLASSVTKDGVFLKSLLLEMYQRKSAGKTGLDLLPSFLQIDKNYGSKLLQEFNVDRVAKGLLQLGGPLASQMMEINKFRRFVNDAEVKAITFDVFDTLVNRPTETPADMYRLLEGKILSVTNGVAEDFSRVRLAAEVETRNSSQNGEITLDEIYLAVQSHYGLSDEVIAVMKTTEIDFEVSMIKPRPLGLRLWDIAKQTGKQIHIISDMYLPESVIEQILSGLGYVGYSRLFVSSTYGVRKKEGGLFDLVLAELGLLPDQILHIGDNRVADIEQPKLRGMRTYRLLRAIDRLRGSDLYKEIYAARSGAGERARTVLAGLTAHALFDEPSGEHEKNSHFQGQPYNLGYAGLGPLITGYAQWLGRQAKRDGITRLYFLSREGWLLKQVYDALHANTPGAVPSTYLYASRRATRVASLQGIGDLLALAGQPYQDGVAVGELLQSRFGISPGAVSAEQWQSAGFSGADERLVADGAGRIRFAALCRALAELILAQSADERQVYLGYLQQVGLSQEPRPAVVDIGWKANMQGALGVLLGKPLTGYYYATLQGAEVWLARGHACWGYLGDMLAANHPSVVIQNRHLIEYLVCHTEPSLIRMAKSGDFTPVFRVEEQFGRRRALLDQVHLGAVQLAKDVASHYAATIPLIWIDPFLAERAMASFIRHPHPVDAGLLKEHFFEDALGGIKRKYIISPNPRGAEVESVWKVGAQAVHGIKKPVVANNQKEVKKAAPASSPVAVANVETLDANETGNEGILLGLEKRFIKKLSNDRKFAKYLRDRDLFFYESKIGFVKAWGRFVR